MSTKQPPIMLLFPECNGVWDLGNIPVGRKKHLLFSTFV